VSPPLFTSSRQPPLEPRIPYRQMTLLTCDSIFQATVAKQLQRYLKEWQRGLHEDSVISSHTVESLSNDDQETWQSIRKDLEDLGLSTASIETNKAYIVEWFKEAIRTGAFDEKPPEKESIADADTEESYPSESPSRELSMAGMSSDQWEDKDTKLAEGSIGPMMSGALQTTSQQSHLLPSVNLITPHDDPPDTTEPPVKARLSLSETSSAKSSPISPTSSATATDASSATSLSDSTPSQTRAPSANGTGKIRNKNTFLRLPSRPKLPRIASSIHKLFYYDADLAWGVQNKDVRRVRRHLQNGMNANHRVLESGTWRSLLDLATICGSVEIARLLLQNGAHPHGAGTTLSDGGFNGEQMATQYPIHYAAQFGHKEILILLLEYGASDIDATNGSSETPLHLSMKARYESFNKDGMTKLLLDLGADPEIRDHWGRTPLALAAITGDEEVVQKLLASHVRLETRDSRGRTALFSAALRGQDRMVQILAMNGAEVDATDEEGVSALFAVAAAVKDEDQMSVVSRARSTFSSKISIERNSNDQSQRSFALTDERIIQNLINVGADRDFKNALGHTPLYAATVSSKDQIAQFLVERGADASVIYRDGDTVLHQAAKNRMVALASLVLQKWPTVSQGNAAKETPLHLAATNSEATMLSLLLSHGADPEIRDEKGRTALHFAAERGDTGGVRVLVEGGARVESQDDRGWTPRRVAAEGGHVEVMQMLVLMEGGSADLKGK
jgi:uncharacterized protein